MFKIVHDVIVRAYITGFAEHHHSLEKCGSESTSLVAYDIETTEQRFV